MRKLVPAILVAASVGISLPADFAAKAQTLPPAAPHEYSSLTGDRRIDAVIFGLASVAVDSEATAMRINELEDRIARLERRLAALEAKLAAAPR